MHFGDDWHDTAIYDRLALPVGHVINGPAILEQPDTTVLIEPGLQGRVDQFGNTIIEPAGGRSMSDPKDWNLSRTALLTIDLQNDFIHPEGAYGRAGQSAPSIAALPERIAPLVNALRAKGGRYVSAQFTLVPDRRRRTADRTTPETAAPVSGQG